MSPSPGIFVSRVWWHYYCNIIIVVIKYLVNKTPSVTRLMEMFVVDSIRELLRYFSVDNNDNKMSTSCTQNLFSFFNGFQCTRHSSPQRMETIWGLGHTDTLSNWLCWAVETWTRPFPFPQLVLVCRVCSCQGFGKRHRVDTFGEGYLFVCVWSEELVKEGQRFDNLLFLRLG